MCKIKTKVPCRHQPPFLVIRLAVCSRSRSRVVLSEFGNLNLIWLPYPEGGDLFLSHGIPRSIEYISYIFYHLSRHHSLVGLLDNTQNHNEANCWSSLLYVDILSEYDILLHQHVARDSIHTPDWLAATKAPAGHQKRTLSRALIHQSTNSTTEKKPVCVYLRLKLSFFPNQVRSAPLVRVQSIDTECLEKDEYNSECTLSILCDQATNKVLLVNSATGYTLYTRSK